MNGEPEAIARVPPAATGSADVNAAQSTTLVAATSTGLIPIPGAVPVSPGIALPGATGGCWITFIWLPTVADQIVRLRFGNDQMTAAVATDRAFSAGVEYDYWVPYGYTHFRGLSAGGGELSWHRSSR